MFLVSIFNPAPEPSEGAVAVGPPQQHQVQRAGAYVRRALPSVHFCNILNMYPFASAVQVFSATIQSKVPTRNIFVLLGDQQRAKLETGGLSGHEAQNLRAKRRVLALCNCNIFVRYSLAPVSLTDG
jgi:hypothetical protein